MGEAPFVKNGGSYNIKSVGQARYCFDVFRLGREAFTRVAVVVMYIPCAVKLGFGGTPPGPGVTNRIA